MGEHSTARASRRRGRPFTRWRNNTRNMAKTFAQAGHPWTENNHMIEITKFSNKKRTSKAFNAYDVVEMGIERWILHIEVHIWYILCPHCGCRLPMGQHISNVQPLSNRFHTVECTITLLMQSPNNVVEVCKGKRGTHKTRRRSSCKTAWGRR